MKKARACPQFLVWGLCVRTSNVVFVELLLPVINSDLTVSSHTTSPGNKKTLFLSAISFFSFRVIVSNGSSSPFFPTPHF